MPQVSIIMPLYNSAPYMHVAIDSVLKQTFQDWALILVNDASSDETESLALAYTRRDDRIRLLQHQENRGAAAARNTALSTVDSRFVAYLDSDDFWHEDKLRKQLEFAIENTHAVTITSYSTVEADGTFRNSIVVPEQTNRHRFLKQPPTCTHTMLVDTTLASKELLRMPPLKRRQDAATWLQLLKAGHDIWGMPEVLAYNRKRPDSLSSNKFAAVRGTWFLYTKVERLHIPLATYYIVHQVLFAFRKRRKQG